MGEHDGWRWQGRQWHGWFGSGTKPDGSSGDDDAAGALERRIASVPLMVIAGLPADKRYHRAATFDADARVQFGRAMRGWVSGIALREAAFADRYFGSSPERLGIDHFRNAASVVATASSAADMREAADEVASGMLAVGLDQWPGLLRVVASRAAAAPATAAYQEGLEPVEYGRVARVASARISGGTVDLVSGPGDTVRGVATPRILEVEEKLAKITEEVKEAANNSISEGMDPRVLGIMLHTLFKNAADEAIKRGELGAEVRTEQTFANGDDRRYGEKGAHRTDVILMEAGSVIAVWDYKTGAGSYISNRRVNQLRAAVTKGTLAPTVYFKVLHVPFVGRRE